MSETSVPNAGRRNLLKASAWAVPVIALAASAPAAAASGGGTLPVTNTYAQSYGVSNQGWSGNPGPIRWGGGQFQTQNTVGGTLEYTIILTGPGGLNVTLGSGTATLAAYGGHSFTGIYFGTAPMAHGTYTFTLTGSGSGGIVQATDSVTI